MRTDYIGQRTLNAPTDEENRPIGVAHADDLQYVMPGYWYGTGVEEDPDSFMIDRFTSWFAHFAKTGWVVIAYFIGFWYLIKLYHLRTPLNTTENWPPCNATYVKMLYNGVDTQVGDPAFAVRYALWDELFPTDARSGGAAWRLGLPVAIATGVAWRLFGKLM